jgi:hypothetical protein
VLNGAKRLGGAGERRGRRCKVDHSCAYRWESVAENDAFQTFRELRGCFMFRHLDFGFDGWSSEFLANANSSTIFPPTRCS